MFSSLASALQVSRPADALGVHAVADGSFYFYSLVDLVEADWDCYSLDVVFVF